MTYLETMLIIIIIIMALLYRKDPYKCKHEWTKWELQEAIEFHLLFRTHAAFVCQTRKCKLCGFTEAKNL